MKWKVVDEFKGTPDRVNTPPPLRELVIQSPTSAAGTLANRSPSMLKPPAGAMTDATPAGGGAARPGWFPKRSKESRMKQIEISARPFGVASIACLIESSRVMSVSMKIASPPVLLISRSARRPASALIA